MKIHRLQRRQYLSIKVEEAWDFFSNPTNLAIITPPWLGFVITSQLPERMHAGMLISYRLRPLFNLPIDWVTEITHAQEPQFFVDEQRVGPYRFWHHQHFFREAAVGTEMEDIVHYALPFGPLGQLTNRLFVRAKLEEIFDFRRHTLAQRFGDPFTLK